MLWCNVFFFSMSLCAKNRLLFGSDCKRNRKFPREWKPPKSYLWVEFSLQLRVSVLLVTTVQVCRTSRQFLLAFTTTDKCRWGLTPERLHLDSFSLVETALTMPERSAFLLCTVCALKTHSLHVFVKPLTVAQTQVQTSRLFECSLNHCVINVDHIA